MSFTYLFRLQYFLRTERLTMRFSSLLTIFLLIGLGSARQRKGSSNDDQSQNEGIAETDRDGKCNHKSPF